MKVNSYEIKSAADLSYADLHNADLCNVKSNFQTQMFNLQCPEEGSFIGWKLCQNNVLVKLKITKDAKRSSATSRKCRCSKAKVLDVIGANVAHSNYDHSFTYRKGEIVSEDNFCEDRWQECAAGIHFFLTRAEAEMWR